MATVLAVDDDRSFLAALSSGLPPTHTVTIANDAADALRLCKEGSYDILITDLSLTSMSGLELVHRVHDVCPETKVLFLTSTPEKIALKLSAEHIVLTKPSSIQDIRDAVTTLLTTPEVFPDVTDHPLLTQFRDELRRKLKPFKKDPPTQFVILSYQMM